MIQIIREVSADLVKRGSTRAVYAKQNDKNSRFLNVRIQEDGKDILIESTSKVVLNVERPDKSENMFYGTVNADGTVKIPLSSWMLELEGTLLCDVSIIEEGSDTAKLTTTQFNIYVEAAVISDESFVDTEEYSLIIDLLNRTTEAERIASSIADYADALRNNCVSAASAANTAAQRANEICDNIEDKVRSTKTLWQATNSNSMYSCGDVIDIPAITENINDYEAFIIDLESLLYGKATLVACRTPGRRVFNVFQDTDNPFVAYIEGSKIGPKIPTINTYAGFTSEYVILGIHADNKVEVLGVMCAEVSSLTDSLSIMDTKISGIHGICSRKA